MIGGVFRSIAVLVFPTIAIMLLLAVMSNAMDDIRKRVDDLLFQWDDVSIKRSSLTMDRLCRTEVESDDEDDKVESDNDKVDGKKEDDDDKDGDQSNEEDQIRARSVPT
jgi:hypothetical protein